MFPTIEDEAPIASIPATAGWSENYCFDGFDPRSGMAFWIHCGRWRQAPDIWREQLLLYLPDGSFMVMRGYGDSASANGPGGACLHLTCEEPGSRWRLRYRGPARHLTSADLAAAPVREGLLSFVDLDLCFEQTYPVWNFGVHEGEIWASSHYEQPGRVTGAVRAAGTTTQFDGNGYRDHSRGPRDQTTLAGSCWIHGQFRDRAFALFEVRTVADGKIVSGLSEAVIFTKDEVIPAKQIEVPRLTSLEIPPPTYRLVLDSRLGVMEIDAAISKTLTLSVEPFGDGFNGFTPSIANIGSYEQPTLFTWQGETGAGHTERTWRLRPPGHD